MKILLYEPGKTGHRPVIFRYTQKVLDRAGVSWGYESRDLRYRPAELVRKARAEGCDLIYIMTLESLAGFAWKVSWLAKRHRIRVVCTYYLFNNLREGWKSWVWRLLLLTSSIDTIFVSDDGLRDGPRKYPRQVRFLPDPWDPDEFPKWTQEAARKELDLPVDAVIFLMFGAIDERKGADTLLKAILQIAEQPSVVEKVIFVLAGKPTEKITILYEEVSRELPSNMHCLLHGHHIPEDMVSCYFYAADYVVNAYPPYFKVSSGSVTRALAAGRPIIVPDHGVNAELVERTNVGCVFSYSKKNDLCERLLEAISCGGGKLSVWVAQCERSRNLGKERELVRYGEFLTACLHRLRQ